MAQYRILVVHRADENGNVIDRYKCQRRGWFLWNDLKHCTHFNAEVGPFFSTTWHDSIVEARQAIYYDANRRVAQSVQESPRVVEEMVL